MAPNHKLLPTLLATILTLCCYTKVGLSNVIDESRLKTYIVYVHHPENLDFHVPEEREKWYASFLPTSDAISSRIVYSYGEAIKGFAARLTPEEVEAMKEKQGFVAAYPSRSVRLHTTHTPDFLGLSTDNNLWSKSSYGGGVIVGLLDSGLTPDHPSFRENNLPPPPAKWKGRCDLPRHLCNNKIIGFKTFVESAQPAIGGYRDENLFDNIGHGTHTASTAVGSPVNNANMLGQANGTAVGMAPAAHLAMYRVCQYETCETPDIIAGFDAAIEDGVDVLSVSLGSDTPEQFYQDDIAIASFRAMQNGMLVSCSAGNDGPYPTTLGNDAPWILTVAASTTDRALRSEVKLGNGLVLEGESLYQPKNFSSTVMPLWTPSLDDMYYDEDMFRDVDVKGKMVICTDVGELCWSIGENLKKAGGGALVVANSAVEGYTILVYNLTLPASQISYADGLKLKYYMSSAKNPTATVSFKGTVMGVSPSPTISFFSSRGPSYTCPGILKPDITGPGINIIAAWFRVYDQRPEAKLFNNSFNVISGTSMSAPHLSGIAALLRSEHPDWSPAAIKSALMTTAHINDRDGHRIKDEQHHPANMFAMGAGHVNPAGASDPGLIYDIQPGDYISFLCQLYNNKQVGIIVGRPVNCHNVRKVAVKDLNYPSISVFLVGKSSTVTVTRTVTHICQAGSAYRLKLDVPEGVRMRVKPAKLTFSNPNEKKSYTVTFVMKNGDATISHSEGYLSWVSDRHVVRIPISVNFTSTA